jgi:general stress protein 26
MSSSFSNADVGNKTADPYTAKNIDPASLKDKVEDLFAFINKTKFCMLTTQAADSDLLASRCMALAAQVRSPPHLQSFPPAAEAPLLSPIAHMIKAFVANNMEPQEGHGFDLLFHTNTESGKTDDLAQHKSVNVSFVTPSGEWASLSGHASIETDRELVRKYYSPGLKAWLGDLGDGKHDGGPEDPRIGIIRVKVNTAQYAVSKRTVVGGLVELAKGVATGESPNVNKLRHISEEEVQQWRAQ